MGRNQRSANSKTNTECDRNSVTGNSSAEINRLSSEINSRISREMDEMMNSVSVQIQRAMSDAISSQVLPQIQNAIMAGSGYGARKGWDVPSERPELNSEVQRNLNAKNNLRNEQDENQLDNDYPDLNVYDKLILKRDKTADFETRQNSRFSKRDKTADFQNETKQPIFKTGQNSRFSKRNKTADFRNETKQPILKTGQNSRF